MRQRLIIIIFSLCLFGICTDTLANDKISKKELVSQTLDALEGKSKTYSKIDSLQESIKELIEYNQKYKAQITQLQDKLKEKKDIKLVKLENLEAKLKNYKDKLKNREDYFSEKITDLKTAKLEAAKALDEINDKYRKLEKKNQGLQDKCQVTQELLHTEEKFINEIAKAYQDLGTSYANLKFYKKAIDAYERSLDFIPENFKVRYNLGILYEHALEDSDKALKHLKQVLDTEINAKEREKVEKLIKLIEKDYYMSSYE